MRNVKNLALFVLMPALMSTTAVADIHYVNPGESIQAAIDVADPGDEIGVAPGFYFEALLDFNGKAIRLYSTGGPDVTIIDGLGAYHVVQCVHSEGHDTILEGFTITGGNADTSPNGGGMYNLNSSPTVTNCTFIGNSADFNGGGMYNYGGSPTVTNCTFINNTANEGGGGMYNENASPTVTNCTFSGNIAIDGGGMCDRNNSSSMVTNCTFSGNTAEDGGGLFIELGSPTLTDCTFTDNTAMNFGGMGIVQSSPTVTNCTFSGNTVVRSAGGMGNVRSSSSTVTNCTFSGNSADFNGGGGMWNEDCSPTITNCTFIKNTTNEGGGGMCNRNNSSPMVTNCTFSGNIAIDGGGMCNRNNSSPMVTNCILWADSPDEIFDELGSSPTVTYSNVQGGWPGTGNIDTDPMFADAEGRLSLSSPCIDAGNDAAVPPGVTTDIDGNPRIQGVCVDMGAFESDCIIFSGWVWMDSDSDFGYSLDKDDLLYFLSFGPVWYYNITTSQWSQEGPVGWVYVYWPFLYESATSTMIFALPPESGLWVYHFHTGEWSLWPRIIP